MKIPVKNVKKYSKLPHDLVMKSIMAHMPAAELLRARVASKNMERVISEHVDNAFRIPPPVALINCAVKTLKVILHEVGAKRAVNDTTMNAILKAILKVAPGTQVKMNQAHHYENVWIYDLVISVPVGSRYTRYTWEVRINNVWYSHELHCQLSLHDTLEDLEFKFWDTHSLLHPNSVNKSVKVDVAPGKLRYSSRRHPGLRGMPKNVRLVKALVQARFLPTLRLLRGALFKLNQALQFSFHVTGQQHSTLNEDLARAM